MASKLIVFIKVPSQEQFLFPLFQKHTDFYFSSSPVLSIWPQTSTRQRNLSTEAYNPGKTPGLHLLMGLELKCF